MSSKLSDINDLYIVMGQTKPSSAVVTAVTATGVDFQTCPNNNMFAVQVIGTVAGTETVFLGKIQEAPNITSGYTDISGAVFSTITSTTGAGIVQAINFQRTQPFLRYIASIVGTTAGVALDVLFLGQKGQLP